MIVWGGEGLYSGALNTGGRYAMGPTEVFRLRFDSDGQGIAWDSTGATVLYDVLRGDLGQLPVGSGPAEICYDSGLSGSSTSDPTEPEPGSGFWYVVRATTACDTATYGFESSNTERISATCP